jgi:hypothetical protein
MLKKEILEQVSVRTGLSVSACTDMLNGGWSYVEDALGSRWVRPTNHVH